MLLGEDSVVKLQDINKPFLSVNGSGKEGSELAWKWLREKWDSWLDGRKARETSLLRGVVASGCAGASLERANEVLEFFQAQNGGDRVRKSPQIERTVKQTVERTKLNAAFCARTAADTKIVSNDFWQQFTA